MQLLDLPKALELFDPVIGLEVHIELGTKTKMFSPAINPASVENADSCANLPNVCTDPVCLGLPGTLPTINARAVEFAVMLGLSMGCKIANTSVFDRKNYFYPDNPKNYQISQFYHPIAQDGKIEIEYQGSVFDIKIERAHMEEDAGKLLHEGEDGRIGTQGSTLIDYNRAGVPLLEIVTGPIVGTGPLAPKVAALFVQNIRDLAKSLGVSRARMEEGNIRCDVNVSLMPKGSSRFGTRTETKNLNSLKSIEKAVLHEICRQAAVLSSGDTIVQETRHFDEKTAVTLAGRRKTDAGEYRYFPEPDLPPLVLLDEYIERIRRALPPSPTEMRKRLLQEWGLTKAELADIYNADLLSEVQRTVECGIQPQFAKKWWMGEVSRIAASMKQSPSDIITPEHIAQLQKLIEEGKLNDILARKVLALVVEDGKSPLEVMQENGIELQTVDESALRDCVRDVLLSMPDIFAKIKDGKHQAAGPVIGLVLKKFGGSADAAKVKSIIMELASSL